MGDSQWAMNCVLFGAGLFRQLSRGQVTKEEALAKIRELTSQFTDEEVTYLLKRLNDLVYSGKS